jgi:chromate transporter
MNDYLNILGYVHYRVIGATLAGVSFVFPSFIMVLALGYAYVKAGAYPGCKLSFMELAQQ